VYVEEQNLSQETLMRVLDEFKNDRGSVLFSVIGGRLSEGMDFPAEELEIAVLVGIPYPRPTAKQRGLEHYYDVKFGKGWEYTVKAPALRKMLQSLGRLIRSESDRGVGIILDRRGAHFKKYIEGLERSTDILADLRKFFKN
jgi:DNA excision repair protein ERCC-2